MNPERNGLKSAFDQFGIGHHLTKISAHRPEHLEFALQSQIEHLGRGKSGFLWNGKSPSLGEFGCVLPVDRQSTREDSSVSAHLRPALDAGVAADRH